MPHDLESALMTLVGEGGLHGDPAIRRLAVDALVVAHLEGVNWLDQVTIVHGLPGSGDVPMVFAAWTEGR